MQQAFNFFSTAKWGLNSILWQFIVIFTLLVIRLFLRSFVYKFVIFIIRTSHFNLGKGKRNEELMQSKARTLSILLKSISSVVIYSIIIIIFLNMGGINIRPFLAGAGIVGFAIGFGSQSLIKDLASGIFIIMENQFNVGDKVKIGTMSGTVRKLTPRSTVIKDEEGNYIYISNGTINNVTNMSQGKHALPKSQQSEPASTQRGEPKKIA